MLLHNSAVLHYVTFSVIKHEPLRLVCFDTQDTGHTDMLHISCDLDLDPMTQIHELKIL